MAADGFKSLTEEQRDDLQDLISSITNVYDDEILMSREAYEASGIEAEEAKLFVYVDELLAAKDAEIAALKRQPGMVASWTEGKMSGIAERELEELANGDD